MWLQNHPRVGILYQQEVKSWLPVTDEYYWMMRDINPPAQGTGSQVNGRLSGSGLFTMVRTTARQVQHIYK